MPPKKTKSEQQLVCINLPEVKVSRDPHTMEEIAKAAADKRLSRIAREFDNGFKFIRKYPRSVTFYGSARFKPGNPHYKDARALAYRLSKEGFAIVTGGGPGIMEAANRGAKDAGGPSIGLNIELPREQIVNPFVTESHSFFYFFSRKTALSFSAEAYIFYPGGFGTLDEFFEIVTLIQTKKIHRIPVILVGADYWAPMDAFLKEHAMRRHAAIDKKELSVYQILDDHDDIISIIRAANGRANPGSPLKRGDAASSR